ncbi:MAG: LysR family transcriptional regulator [Nitratireductor sp.]|nr:LysR family transcriptional regulator [Nitratireductor sp.]
MKLSGPDLHLLAVFDSVVRNKGFSAAQAELGLSQPTISNHITALETRLGMTLCQRGRRGFQLTEKGQRVHEIATDLMQWLDSHSNELTALKGSLVGHLRVAVVDCVATDPSMRLPQTINSLLDTAPGIKVDLSIERPQSILSGLNDGRFHIGIGSFDNKVGGLSYERLYEESHSLYCGQSHPLVRQTDREVTQDEMDACVWVHRGYWNRQRQRTQKVIEADRIVDDIEAQILFVLSGRYIGLLPDHAAEPHVAAGRLRQLPLHEDNFICTMELVCKLGRQPKIVQLFCKALTDQCRK